MMFQELLTDSLGSVPYLIYWTKVNLKQVIKQQLSTSF